jgi:death-on-curing protein
VSGEERQEPDWIELDTALAIHEAQLAEHGGGAGVRDAGLLESALAKPLNLWSYGEPDFAALGAAYGYGLAKNHPFVDGNKRTAFAVMVVFLLLNNVPFEANEEDAVLTMLKLAAGDLDEAALADWIRRNSAPR